ncbi:MAG: DUF1512 family protein [Promethearchaeota archaeon]
MYNIFQLGQERTTDPFAIILNLLFFLLIFVSMFYGQRIQAWKAAKEIEAGLEKIKKWNDDCKKILLSKFKLYADKTQTDKDIAIKLEDFITFVTIIPVMLDPYQIIPKLDHVIDVRDYRFKEEVAMLAPNADSTTQQSLENLLEAAMAIDFIYRLIKHYLILGKKSKSMILLLQIAMQMGIILALAKAFFYASKAFAEGSPIGDALGPMVVGKFIRDVTNNSDVEARDITKDTIVQEVTFEDRTVYVIRAKGPGGTVGKPGKAIKDLIEQYGDSISRIIMIDAGLKLTGEKTGSIAVGVGAAIGGIGVEKYYIEESTTKKTIPIDALICKQSLEDAITTMKRSITQSVPLIVEKIKMAIRKRTEKGTKVIVAGIGNTMGIGI